MRVTRENTLAAPQADTVSSKPRSRSYVPLQVGLLILAFGLGFAVHQQGWHRPLVSFATSLVQRPGFTVAALLHRSDLPVLHVDVRFADYQRLLDKRNQALRLGANVASEQDDVPATMRHAATTVTVQMRLLEGPAGGFDGEAWPYAVAVEDDGTLSGLRRFTLVPADATVLSNWGYLETLRGAGLLSPRYYPVRLILNGRSQGVYVLEEQLTAEALAAQRRAGSVPTYFDGSAYWEAYARLGDALPGSGFQYAQAVADCAPGLAVQGGGDSADAPPAATACADAVDALQALQAGERDPADAWDAEEMGTFLALTTLWHGTSELDWRTMRLIYDPSAMRFEPVGAGVVPTPVAPLPERFIDDPGLQAAYARALARFSAPDYVARLQIDLADEISALRRALVIDMGYLELPWDALEAHQAVMQRQIAPSRTLFAHIEATQGGEDDALVLCLSNVQPFPIEIVGLDIGEAALLPVRPAWVAESDRALLVDTADALVLRAAGSVPQSVCLHVPAGSLPDSHGLTWQAPDTIHVVTRLFGLADQIILVAARYTDPASPRGSDGRSP